jgi:hypothetical protein
VGSNMAFSTTPSPSTSPYTSSVETWMKRLMSYLLAASSSVCVPSTLVCVHVLKSHPTVTLPSIYVYICVVPSTLVCVHVVKSHLYVTGLVTIEIFLVPGCGQVKLQIVNILVLSRLFSFCASVWISGLPKEASTWLCAAKCMTLAERNKF